MNPKMAAFQDQSKHVVANLTFSNLSNEFSQVSHNNNLLHPYSFNLLLCNHVTQAGGTGLQRNQLTQH